jgi:hypothetical protein
MAMDGALEDKLCYKRSIRKVVVVRVVHIEDPDSTADRSVS